MKIDTKRNIGDVVYYMKNNRIETSKITGIFTYNTDKPAYDRVEYSLSTENDKDRYEENKFYSSKEELLKTL